MTEPIQPGTIVASKRLLVLKDNMTQIRIEQGTPGIVEDVGHDDKITVSFEHNNFGTVRKTVSPQSVCVF